MRSLAQRVVIVATFAVFCSFCFEVAECERGSDDHPGPCDITTVYMICNGAKHFKAWSPYDVAVGDIKIHMILYTHRNGYNYFVAAQHDGVLAYGHAACNGRLTEMACYLCLSAADDLLFVHCGLSIGAQIQLKDCRYRYENYPFIE